MARKDLHSSPESAPVPLSLGNSGAVRSHIVPGKQAVRKVDIGNWTREAVTGCAHFAGRPKDAVHGGSATLVAGLVVLLFLGACSSPGPREYDNACDIRYDHPDWIDELARTERKWGVPRNVILATMYQESRFDADAKTPRRYVFFGMVPWGRQSSAYGYAQVLDGTWDWYRSETGSWFARRDNFGHAVDFMGWYMDKTTRKAGVSKSDAYNQYLAYHQGHRGYLEGRYRNIEWLKDAARSVDARSRRYERQLLQCA